jgi:hypothetical protein
MVFLATRRPETLPTAPDMPGRPSVDRPLAANHPSWEPGPPHRARWATGWPSAQLSRRAEHAEGEVGPGAEGQERRYKLAGAK